MLPWHLLGRPFFNVVSCSENSTAGRSHEIRIKDPKTSNPYVFATQPCVCKTPCDSSDTPIPREERKCLFEDGPVVTQSSPFTSRRKNLFPTAEPSDPSTGSNFYCQASSFYTPRSVNLLSVTTSFLPTQSLVLPSRPLKSQFPFHSSLQIPPPRSPFLNLHFRQRPMPWILFLYLIFIHQKFLTWFPIMFLILIVFQPVLLHPPLFSIVLTHCKSQLSRATPALPVHIPWRTISSCSPLPHLGALYPRNLLSFKNCSRRSLFRSPASQPVAFSTLYQESPSWDTNIRPRFCICLQEGS